MPVKMTVGKNKKLKIRRTKVKKNKKILKRGLTRPWEMARKKKKRKLSVKVVRAVKGKIKKTISKVQVSRLKKKLARKKK